MSGTTLATALTDGLQRCNQGYGSRDCYDISNMVWALYGNGDQTGVVVCPDAITMSAGATTQCQIDSATDTSPLGDLVNFKVTMTAGSGDFTVAQTDGSTLWSGITSD